MFKDTRSLSVALSGLPNLYAIIRERSFSERYRVAPSTFSPPVQRAVALGGRRTREAQPRFAFPYRTRGIRVILCLVRHFGKVPNHNGEGSTISQKSV